MSTETRSGPLQDITIIDCTMAYAGPFGTVLLADLGANVIKVEPPKGDTFRMMPPFPPDYGHAAKGTDAGADYGMSFAGVNRNKRSVVLDLKDADDKAVFLELCRKADAVVENMRAGVMDELGLGYETIAAHHPKIVYGAVRGFGDPRTGASPYADWPCLDVAGQSFGGLVEATGDLWSIAIADIYPGTLMALGLLAAVHRARATGQGEFFDVAMYDGVLSLLKANVPAYGLTGKQARASDRALVPFGMFPTTDGQIAIAAPVERHWAVLCKAMGREDLIIDERTSSNLRRAKHRDFTNQIVTEWTVGKTKAEVLDTIGGAVPCGPANTLEEVFNDPHVAARNMLQPFDIPGENPGSVLTGNPIKFTRSTTSFYQRPPKLGEHTDEVLAEFGITRKR